MQEHLAGFFTDFGLACTAGGHNFTAILDAPYAEALGMSNSTPVLHARTTDVNTAALTYNSAVTVGGTAYTVREIQPDGTGMTAIALEAA